MSAVAVTIVMPVFNPNPRYLQELFSSIAGQSFQDFDMVISDDADAEAMINSMLPASLKLRTTYVKNIGSRGIFNNLNHAIRHASGRLIQILCQDDVLLPFLLEKNKQMLDDTPDAVMAFSHFDFIDERSKPLPFVRNDLEFIPSVIPASDANNFFLYFGCMPGNLSPVMLTQAAVREAGYFDEQYRYAGDYEYWIRIARYGSICFSKTVNLYIRDHDERASGMLGTFERYKELRPITLYLINHNTIPVSKYILRRYLHIHLFRCIVSYTGRKILSFKRVDWKSIFQIYNGKPYSLGYSILSFFKPVPAICTPLKAYMEIPRK